MKPALLFDLDGTLTDDDDLHFIVMREMFAGLGVTLDMAAFNAHIVGSLNADIARRFFPKMDEAEAARLFEEKEALFRKRAAGALTPKAGVVDLIDFARAHDVGVALVTNAPRANADALLKAFGLTDRFQAIVSGDAVERAKPDPFPYLAGLKALGADAARAVAFEDSRTGASAAVGAGLTTIGIAHGEGAQALMQIGVSLTVEDFRDPRVLALVRAKLAV